MDVFAMRANTSFVQAALSVVAALQLTTPLFPESPTLADGDCYDVIVVGAGSAGATLAARLAERGDLTVLLLEAGGDPPLESLYPALLGYLPHSQWDWNYTAESIGAHQNGRVPLTRGRMLGGTSGVNYMAYVRGHADDYDAWAAAVDDPAWSWPQLLPFFMRSERLEDRRVLNSRTGYLHGVSGPLGVTRQPYPQNKKYLEAFREAGHQIVDDINGGNTLGYTEPLFTIAQGVRQSTAFSYLRSRCPNLHIARYTRVTRVLIDESRTATGVRARIRDGEEVTLRAARQVVLSAGAINTPHLLQLSGVGPARMLQHFGIPVLSDLPVGYNLQDHLATLLVFLTEPADWSPRPSPPSTRFPVPLVMGWATPADDGGVPVYETANMVLPADTPALLQFCSGAFGLRDDFCQQLHEETRGREVMLTVLSALHGKSRGTVSLRSADPDDAPLIDLGFYSAESDVEDMVDFVEHHLRVTNSSYFRYVGGRVADTAPAECEGLERMSRTYWRCYVRAVSVTQFHYGGTSALGAVLDARLRVHGVRGLRVADAGAMPLLPGGNINAPTIMLAERAAHLMLQDLPPTRAPGAHYYEYTPAPPPPIYIPENPYTDTIFNQF